MKFIVEYDKVNHMMTKDKAHQIHADINKALEEVAKKHGLIPSKMGRLTYNDTRLKYKTEFGVVGAEGHATGVDPKWVNNAHRYGVTYGLMPADLGKEFILLGTGNVTYIGMTSSKKAVVKARDGRMFRIGIDKVAYNLVGK